MKLYKTKKDLELFYYFTVKKEKRWMFRHRYYDALGKRREKSKQGFTSETEAYRALLEVKTNILNGNVKLVSNGNLTVSEWLDIWYETKSASWKLSTRIERTRMINDVIKPILGGYILSKLDLITYERVFINELLKRIAPSTTKLYHNLFKIAVNEAVTNKTIKENNFKYLKIKGIRKNKDNFLTQIELNTLLDVGKRVANITDYTLLLTLAYTGMRKGEANGLNWTNINFEKKTIKIERTRDQRGVRSPKSENSRREIKVDDVLIRQLKIYHTWCKKKKLSYGQHLAKDDYIFISNRGSIHFDHTAFNESLDRMIEKAKIKRITPHGLRHTHATILLNKGVSVVTIAKRLGNTPEEIHRTYGHSDEAADNQAVEIFSSAINI